MSYTYVLATEVARTILTDTESEWVIENATIRRSFWMKKGPKKSRNFQEWMTLKFPFGTLKQLDLEVF